MFFESLSEVREVQTLHKSSVVIYTCTRFVFTSVKKSCGSNLTAVRLNCTED